MTGLIFYKIKALDNVAEKIAASIDQASNGGKVLLLLSGGSVIDLEIRVLNILSNPRAVTVSLSDERFGPLTHADSNWRQLCDAGLLDTAVNFAPVLEGEDFDTTLKNYRGLLDSAASEYSQIIAVLGMGSDGHTAGILPGSTAASSTDTVAGFEGPDFKRITVTANFLVNIDKAVVYAVGDSKHYQIDRLSEDVPLAEQPVQLLKHIKEVEFYNDYKGEEIWIPLKLTTTPKLNFAVIISTVAKRYLN